MTEPVAAKVPAKTLSASYRPAAPPIPLAKTLVTEEDEEPPVAKRKPLALYGAIAVILLAIIGWLVFRPHTEPASGPRPLPRPKPRLLQRLSPRSLRRRPLRSCRIEARRIEAFTCACGRDWGPFHLARSRLHLQESNQGSGMVAKISGKYSDLGA